jgi:hypothetical protein
VTSAVCGAFPTRRYSITGSDLDGNAVEISFAISRKLYACPACRKPIPIGSEHVVVQKRGPGAGEFHQHGTERAARG